MSDRSHRSFPCASFGFWMRAVNILATFVARMTFDSIRALFAATEWPPEISRMRFKTKGVLAEPVDFALSASRTAWLIIASISAMSIECPSGIGLANKIPESVTGIPVIAPSEEVFSTLDPNLLPSDKTTYERHGHCRYSQIMLAASLSSAMVIGLLIPLSLDQKAGKFTPPLRPSAKVATETPSKVSAKVPCRIGKPTLCLKILESSRKIQKAFATTAKDCHLGSA